MPSEQDHRDIANFRIMLGLNEWDEPLGTSSPLTRYGPNIRGNDKAGGEYESTRTYRPNTIGDIFSNRSADPDVEFTIGIMTHNLKTGELTIEDPKKKAREVLSGLAYLINTAARIKADENLAHKNATNSARRTDYPWIYGIKPSQ